MDAQYVRSANAFSNFATVDAGTLFCDAAGCSAGFAAQRVPACVSVTTTVTTGDAGILGQSSRPCFVATAESCCGFVCAICTFSIFSRPCCNTIDRIIGCARVVVGDGIWGGGPPRQQAPR